VTSSALKPGELSGRLLHGRRASYWVEGVLGQGGMGQVYLAVEDGTNKQVAVKVLAPDLRDDAVANGRFEREAVIGYCLSHPNLVQVIDAGGLDVPPKFLVMERVRGDTLQGSLPDSEAATRHKGPRHGVESLTWVPWVQVGIYVARGLTLLHARGVIHRDVKPANIFLAHSDGLTLEPKLLDYGISKQDVRSGLTHHKDVVGSSRYSAPEQLLDPGDVDERTDQWALAAVIFDLVSPTRRRVGDTFDPEDPGEGWDPGLWRVLAKALSHDRQDRHPNLGTFARGLEHFANGLQFDVKLPLVKKSDEKISWPTFQQIAARRSSQRVAQWMTLHWKLEAIAIIAIVAALAGAWVGKSTWPWSQPAAHEAASAPIAAHSEALPAIASPPPSHAEPRSEVLPPSTPSAVPSPPPSARSAAPPLLREKTPRSAAGTAGSRTRPPVVASSPPITSAVEPVAAASAASTQSPRPRFNGDGL
jgi:serine/threonine-protein kinase